MSETEQQTPDYVCPVCVGKGWITVVGQGPVIVEQGGPAPPEVEEHPECPRCKGTGRIISEEYLRWLSTGE